MRTNRGVVRYALCIGAAFGLLQTSTAHSQRLHVDTYTIEDGLPSSAIFDVGQDALGRLWVVTRGGVVFFDGLEWSGLELGGIKSVSRFESAMATGPAGDIWMVLNEQIPSLVRLSGGEFTSVEIPKLLGVDAVSGWSLAVAGDREDPVVAIGTLESGLLVYAENRWSFLNAPTALPSDSVNDVIAVGDRILAATDGGLCWLEGSGSTCFDPLENGAPASRIAALATVPNTENGASLDRIILAGSTWMGELVGQEIRNVTTLTANERQLSFDQVVMAVGPDESVYFGTHQQVYRLDQERVDAVALGPVDGLVANGATSLLTDREGNVWVGSMRGLSKIVSDHFGSYTAEHGLLEDEVTAVHELRPGSMVFGHNGGLTFFEDGIARTLPFEEEGLGSADGFRVMDMDVDDEEALWVAASGLGLGRLASSGQWTWFKENDGIEISVTSVLCVDGEILVGTQGGLFRRAEGEDTFHSVNPGEGPGVVRRLYLGPDGTVYVATAKYGILARRQGNWTAAHYRGSQAANMTTAVYADSSGQILVGSDIGLLGMAGGDLVDLGEPWSAIKRPVYFIVADTAGTIWVGTDYGVRAWNGNRFWTFDAHHGLVGNETNRGAGMVDSTGRVWIGTDQGVSFRDPGPLGESIVPPIAVILGVETADGVLYPMLEPTKLPHTEQTLVFHFRGISLIDERKQSVRARLVGYDDRWLGSFNLTTAGLRYTHVPPGKYIFEIQAENAYGVRSEVVSSPPLTISGPFWLATWFWGVMVAIGVLIIALVSWHLQRKYRMAFADSLTGLANRAGILRRLEREVRRLGGERKQLAVLLLDLDRFKHINSSLGHRAGDDVLIQSARRLEAAVPHKTPLARLGGDEFVILLTGNQSPADAVVVAKQLQEELARPFMIEGLEAYLGASIGIRMCAGRWANPHHLLRDADAAMIQAQQVGVGSTVLFDASMHSDNLQLLTLEGELQRSAARDQLILYYQPLFHLATNTLAGFEALVRWQHPTRGLLRPESFLSIAETSGLIVEIGGWVIKESCQQLAEWRDRYEGAKDLVISVNLASQQVADPRLVRTIATALENAGLTPTSLKLELTENSIMSSDQGVTSRLEHLRHRELGVWVDDFGTGYSSLSYLQKLPIDALKIDRSFVNDLNGETGDSSIIEAIIALAGNLGLTVIAEGIETEAQLLRLQDLGCSLGQGFFLGRPQPASEIEERFFS